jgi:hypothetical protein
MVNHCLFAAPTLGPQYRYQGASSDRKSNKKTRFWERNRSYVFCTLKLMKGSLVDDKNESSCHLFYFAVHLHPPGQGWVFWPLRQTPATDEDHMILQNWVSRHWISRAGAWDTSKLPLPSMNAQAPGPAVIKSYCKCINWCMRYSGLSCWCFVSAGSTCSCGQGVFSTLGGGNKQTTTRCWQQGCC